MAQVTYFDTLTNQYLVKDASDPTILYLRAVTYQNRIPNDREYSIESDPNYKVRVSLIVQPGTPNGSYEVKLPVRQEVSEVVISAPNGITTVTGVSSDLGIVVKTITEEGIKDYNYPELKNIVLTATTSNAVIQPKEIIVSAPPVSTL